MARAGCPSRYVSPEIDDAQQGPAADVEALPEFLAEDDEVAADADEDRPANHRG